jgi:hypothetical protein
MDMFEYEQYELPDELHFLLHEAHTPLEIQHILLSSLNKTENVTRWPEEPAVTGDTFSDPVTVEAFGSSELDQTTPVGNISNPSNSGSTSSVSPPCSTSRTTNSSDDVPEYKPMKAALSMLLQSKTSLVASFRQVRKESSTTEKGAGSEIVQRGSHL